jgi:hypothetical protein
VFEASDIAACQTGPAHDTDTGVAGDQDEKARVLTEMPRPPDPRRPPPPPDPRAAITPAVPAL